MTREACTKFTLLIIFSLEILCHRAVIDYYTRTSNGNSPWRQWRFKPKNLEAWRWPPRVSVAVPTRVHMENSVIFQRGSNEGILGMTDRIPRGNSGQSPCRRSRVLCSSEAEAKCYVNVHIYFNVLCIKNIQDFMGKGVELMAVNWVQSARWKLTQPYTEFNVNVWHVWLIYCLVLTSRKKQFICRHESGG